MDSPIDLRSDAFQRDPWRAFARMPREAPVARRRLPLLGETWVAASYETVFAMAKDAARFRSDPRATGSRLLWIQRVLPPSLRALNTAMISRDEPDHRRLRGLVDKAFGKRGVEALQERIAAAVDARLNAMEGRDRVDLMTDLARPLPLTVIADLMGVPDADREKFSRWARAIDRPSSLSGVLGGLPKIMAMARYLRSEFERQRRAPQAGLISALLEVEEAGDALSADELLSTVFILLIAGHATTTHLIGDGAWALITHAEQRAWLEADWSRIGSAVEELLRFHAPVQFVARFAGETMSFHGAEIERGKLVMMCLAAANMDPAQFETPERLDLSRAPNRHLSFGTGIHFCLGQQLARMEGRIALERLFHRFPELRLAEPEAPPQWGARLGLQGLASLPVIPGRAAAPR